MAPQRMRILVFGFYDQGNLGDDLMAVMFAELIKSLHAEPEIFSRASRFDQLGYTSTDRLQLERYDAILLGGGALLKSANASNEKIEARMTELAAALAATKVPVVGASLGSDGAKSLEQISPARRAIITSPNVRAIALRLRSDLRMGLTGACYLPDIVFASNHFYQLWGGPNSNGAESKRYLLNLSRRTASALPLAYRLTRSSGACFFLAHARSIASGGEIWLPFWPRFETENISESLAALQASPGIVSSKLHPGIIALSMGREFISVAGRPKTRELIDDYVQQGILATTPLQSDAVRLHFLKDGDWQASLWESYRRFLAKQFGIAQDGAA